MSPSSMRQLFSPPQSILEHHAPNGPDPHRRGRLRILVADPEAMDRAGIAALLGAHPWFVVVAQTSSVEETISRARMLHPDVVVLAVTLPSLDAAPPVAILLRAIPDLRIVALSERGWERCMVLNPRTPSDLPFAPPRAGCQAATDCLHLAACQGAQGTVRRSADPTVLYSAILDVALGRDHLEPSTAEALSRAGGPQTRDARDLSVRELEVVALISQGHSNKEIASALVISTSTVKKHVGHALAKLGLFDRLQIGLHIARHSSLLKPQPMAPISPSVGVPSI